MTVVTIILAAAGASAGPGATPSATLSPAALAAARRYLYGGLVWGLAADVAVLAALWLLWRSGAAVRLRIRLQRHPAVAAPAAVAGLTFVVIAAVAFPFDFYLGFVRERAYGFGRATVAAWLGRWAGGEGVELAVGLAIVLVAYALLRRWRRRGVRWWPRLWALIMLVVIAGAALAPVLVTPLFYRVRRLQDARIVALAARAGIPARRLFVINASRLSGHTNAYTTGILGSQRIVVYDTLLASETPAESDFVVAHEMGHYLLHHIWKGIAFAGLLLFAALWVLQRVFGWRMRRRPRGVGGIEDPAGLPLLLLTLGLLWLAAMPLANTFSRHIEHDADAFGLRLVSDPCAAVATWERFERTDLEYPHPPDWVVFWFFDHPSVQQRIDYARRVGHCGG